MEKLNTAQISTNVITNLSSRFANFLIDKIGKYFKDKKAHDAIYFQTAYEKYLFSTKEKYEKVKTLLYRQAPQYLYDFYECLGVRLKKTIIDTSDINNLLKVGHKLIITGTGGIGKTIMMKHLFLNCIQSTDCIPVLLELRSLNEKNEIDLNKAIYDSLKMFNFELEQEYFNYSLELGKYVFIFDGYDEVKSSLAKKVEEAIFQLTNQFPENYYIISSRPLNNNFVYWSDFTEMEALGLSKEQALSLVKKLKYDENIKNKFYDALDNSLYDKYKTFAINPLLLTIMLMTFEEGGEIPETFSDFYEQAFIALYRSHDASKGAFVRDKAAKLGFNEFKLIFSYVCFKSFFNNQYEFTESNILELINLASDRCSSVAKFNSEDFLKDLTEAVCLLVREGLKLRFSHRSFQEYFAAYYTTQLEDKDQESLIKSWLIEEGFFMSSEFLNMLNDMEPERFDKNILIPCLKDLKAKSENMEKIDIFSLFFDDISLMDNNNFALRINNHYFYSIYRVLSKRYKKQNTIKQKKFTHSPLYEELVKIGFNKSYKSSVPLEIIKNNETLKELFINQFSYIFDIYNFGMKILRDSNIRKPKKKKLHSILKDL